MSDPDTSRIITLAQGGDLSAQQQLLVRHRDRLRRMVMAMMDPRLSARIDPSDVLQGALARAAVRLPKYLEQQPVAFYPWLRKIVKEEMIDAHRHHVDAQRRSVSRESFAYRKMNDTSVMHMAEQLISREPSPSKMAIRRDQLDAVKKGMNQLSESLKELLLMRFIEELSIGEIAEVLGIPESTARLKVLRAIEHLGRIVNKD